MDLRNSDVIELRNFYFTTIWKVFSKNFTRSGKMHHVEINSGTSKSSNVGDEERNSSSGTRKRKGSSVIDHNYFGPKGKTIKVALGKKRQSKANEISDSSKNFKKKKRKLQVPSMVEEINESFSKKRTYKKRSTCSSKEQQKPFKCDMCGSTFVTDPLRRASKPNKSGYIARPRYKIDPVSKERLTLCNACGLKFGRKKKGRKKKPEPSEEDKNKFLLEGQKFAQDLYNDLRDEDGKDIDGSPSRCTVLARFRVLQLYCTYFKRGACGCIQKFIKKDDTVENVHSRASQLLKLMKKSRELRQLKSSSKESGEKRSTKGKKTSDQTGPKAGRPKSQKFEEFIFTERKVLRKEFCFCERGTQRILLYSNNFLHKKRKNHPERPSRIQRQKGSETERKLKPVENLADEPCCLDNCVRMATSHKLLLQQWRDRARSGQAEARRVLAEMLTPSGGSRTNCYKFISWVTGCCLTTISKVNGQMKKTGGNREPPQHGLIKWWKDHPKPKKPKEEKPNKQTINVTTALVQDNIAPLFPAAAFVQPLSILQAAANTSGLTAVIQPPPAQQDVQSNQQDATAQGNPNGVTTIVNLGSLNCSFPQSFISIPTGLGLSSNAFSMPANTFQLQQQLQQQQLQQQIQQLQLQLLQHQQQQQQQHQQQQQQQPPVFGVAFQNPTSSAAAVPSLVSTANTNSALIATPTPNVHTTDSIQDAGLAIVSTQEQQPQQHTVPPATTPQTSTSLPAQVIIAGSNQTSPIILAQTSQGILTISPQPQHQAVAANHTSNATNLSNTVSITPSFGAEGFLNSETFSVMANGSAITQLPFAGIGQLAQIGQNAQVDQASAIQNNLQPAVQVSYIAGN